MDEDFIEWLHNFGSSSSLWVVRSELVPARTGSFVPDVFASVIAAVSALFSSSRFRYVVVFISVLVVCTADLFAVDPHELLQNKMKNAHKHHNPYQFIKHYLLLVVSIDLLRLFR